MKLVLTAFAFITIGFLCVYSFSIPGLVLYVFSTTIHNDYDNPTVSSSERTNIPGTSTEYTLVKITKSFKNSSGFYKIDGTLENQGAIILSDIKVTKYYKIPSVNGTTMVCYEKNIVSCDYKPTIKIHPKSFLLTVPDGNNKSKL